MKTFLKYYHSSFFDHSILHPRSFYQNEKEERIKSFKNSNTNKKKTEISSFRFAFLAQ